MKIPRLDRKSEKYSPLGNISAQGIQKLLGAPSLDRLQTVIREAVQNSCDATVDGKNALFSVNVRELSEDQSHILANMVFHDVVEENSKNCLSHLKSSAAIKVIELADFGTKGLGGPTDASKVTDAQEITDFTDFVLNVGSPRDTKHGGGTYGYGKSSLYGLSLCSTIIIDTLTTWKGKEVRRLIAAKVGSSFSIPTGWHKGKYTGRHWWGLAGKTKHSIEPLTGKAAELLAGQLGMPERKKGDLGTTIMILDPAPLHDQGSEAVLKAIQRTILWNFWPKMIRYKGTKSAMKFSTKLSGRNIKLPDPEECPPLDLFIMAMRDIKQGKSEIMECKSPKQELGELQIIKHQKGERLQGFGPDDDGMFPASSSDVALMRPVELVVKYLEGNPYPSDSVEWAGVFICSSNAEVESAFAASEPPAHDDWNPLFLQKGRGKTFVRTGLRRIKEKMEQTVSSTVNAQQGNGAYLAPLADRMGGLLAGAFGDGPVPVNKRSTSRKSNARKSSVSIRNFRAWGPDQWEDGSVLAWFCFNVEGPDDSLVTLSGTPRVYIDGETMDVGPNGIRPEIRVWADENEDFLSADKKLRIRVKDEMLLWVGVSIPDEVGVTFYPEIIS